MEMALKAVDPTGVKGIHCSFDIDSLDSLEVPSTGTPGEWRNFKLHASYI